MNVDMIRYVKLDFKIFAHKSIIYLFFHSFWGMKDVMISPIPRSAGMMVVIVVMRIPVSITVLNVNVFWLTQVFIFLSFSISYQSFNDSIF